MKAMNIKNSYALFIFVMIFNFVVISCKEEIDGPAKSADQPTTETASQKIINIHPEEDGFLHYDLVYKTQNKKDTTHHKVDMYPFLKIADIDTIRGYRQGGVELTTSKKQTFVNGTEQYVFTMNKSQIVTNAEITLAHQVEHRNETFDIAAKSAAVWIVSIDTTKISKDELTWDYTVNASLLAEDVVVYQASKKFVEVVDPEAIEPEDKITYSVDSIRPNKDGYLYYRYYEFHSAKPELNKNTEYKLNMEGALSAKNIAEFLSQTAGISLTGNDTQAYDGAKTYTFAYDKFEAKADASVKISFVVKHDKEYTIAASGASVKVSNGKAVESSEENYDYYKYPVHFELYVEDVLIKEADTTAPEKVKKAAKDEVSYKVENIRPMADGKLYYDYVETHTVNTELNKKTTYPLNMNPSITAQTIADIFPEEAGLSLLGANTQAYNGARLYDFAFNKFTGSANASVTLSFVVRHDKEYTIAAKGASVKVSLGSASQSLEGNYDVYKSNVTYDLYVENIKVASDMAVATEKIARPVYKNTYEFVSMSRILSKDESKFFTGYIFKVSGEKNGTQVVIPELGIDEFHASSEISGNENECVSAVWNGVKYIPCEVLVDNKNQIFKYRGKNISGDKVLPMGFAEAVIKGIKNYSGNINTSATPVITGAVAEINGKTMNIIYEGKLFHTYRLGDE